MVLVEKMNLHFAREGVQDYIAHTLKSCLAKPLDNAVKSYGLTSNIYLSFASATKVCVLCYLLVEYVTVTSS